MRMRTRVVRGGVWGIVWLVVGCDTGSPNGSIVATILRDNPPVPAAGSQVSLVEASQASMTNVSGKASFPSVPPGTHHVTAKFIGYCVATVVATVTSGTTTFVTLNLGPSPCGSTGSSGSSGGGSGGGSSGGGSSGGGGTDQIATTGSDPLVSLVDIRTGVAGDPAPCENDRLVVGSGGNTDVGANALMLTDPTVPCHGAAWIFTLDHAPWFDNAAATFPWTNSGGDVLTATLPANRLRVPVTIWMAGTFDPDSYKTTMDGDLSKANGFLREQRTGLILTNSETSDATPDIIDVATLGSGSATVGVIGNGCHKTSEILQSTLIYRPAQVNVYVVDEVDGPSGPSGKNCVLNNAPNIIFINSRVDYVTLLHEIGHGLSLLRPHWGHAQAIAGLFTDNMMQSGATIADHVSLGQIARMHADTRSWLNQVTGTGTVRSRQLTAAPMVTACSCPGDAATDDCPKLTTDIPRPGTPNIGVTNPAACHVTTDVSCISLTPSGFAPGSSATITAKGWTDATETTMGVGDATATILDPTLVSITGAEAPGVLKVTVHAGSITGTTKALISLGGTFVTVTVKVGSPCP